MSETDSFIQEVTEEVRQDQMFALWKKWGPYVIGGVAVVVAGAAGWSYMQSQERAAAEARGGIFIAADPATPEAQIALPEQIDGPAKVLADFTAAAALAESGDTDAAAASYAALAGRSDLSAEYLDLARLQAVRLGAEAIDGDATLDQMISGDSAYRLLALELRAARRIAAGDPAGGHADLNIILADPTATTTMRQRAVVILTATGGEVTTDADGSTGDG